MTPATLTRTTLADGLEVSALGFGAMALTGVYGPSESAEDLRTLHHALDEGVTLIDTSDVYAGGENEELLADLLAQRRDEVELATKFGIVGSIAERTMSARNDPAYVHQAVDASLSRLGTDVIDLYYLHRRDVSVPIEEVVGAMAELVTQGKVRHLGLSEVTATEIEAAHAVHPIAAVQSEWSIWSRDVERSVVPTCARLGVGFVPYSPLGRGFLTGTIDTPEAVAQDWRGSLARFSGEGFDANQAVARAISSIAAELDATSAQVALAWLLERGRELDLPVVPIPGTRRPERVSENAAAARVQLTADHLRALNELAAKVVGPRSDNPDPNWTSDQRETAEASSGQAAGQ